MSRVSTAETTCPYWPRWWRMLLVAACTLILCSCRGPCPSKYDAAALDQQRFPGLPPEAYRPDPTEMTPRPYSVDTLGATAGLSSSAGNTVGQANRGTRYAGASLAGACSAPPASGPPGMEQGVPLPYMPAGPWAPPGIARPWPEDEYLRDGGDAALPARVGNQWEVHGLDVEDTIAHYDTLDGRTVVEPSNRVYIYSPRFGAVRQVVSLIASEQMHRSAGVYAPTKPARCDESEPVLSNKQNIQATGQIAARPAVLMRTRQGDGAMSGASGPRGLQDALKPYDDLAIIRQGIVVEAEMAQLACGVQAAIAWTHKQAVEVILEHRAAAADTSYEALQSVYTVNTPDNPRLRVVKVASTPFAEPGDEVSFTIRFDNLGNQPIGNVTIIDNLSGRLEYVPQSAQCSLDAKFSTEPNQADSLVVRCEIGKPLLPGKGGVIHFTCKVR